MEFKQYTQDMISIIEDLYDAADRLRTGRRKLIALAERLDDVINEHMVVIKIDNGLDDDVKPPT